MRGIYHATRRLAEFFHGRWPPAVAFLAVALQAVALSGLPHAWIPGSISSVLFLLLIAHAGRFGQESGKRVAELRAITVQAMRDSKLRAKELETQSKNVVNEAKASMQRVKELETEARQTMRDAKASQYRVRELDVRAREALAEAQARAEERTAKIAFEHSARMNAFRSELQTSVNVIEAGGTSNAAGFRTFNRRLSPSQIAHIRETWLPALGLDLTPRALAYLGHRVCQVEDQCVGRLAASIEDMLVRILAAKAVSGPNLAVLEIGTLFGIGLASIHDACYGCFERISLTALDPLEGYYGRHTSDIITGVPVTRRIFEFNMQRVGVPVTDLMIIQELSTSDEALTAARSYRYNMLIIDGDHSREGVKADFERYSGLVRPGGFIVFDDYAAPEWPGVKSFVDEDVRPRSDVELVRADFRSAVFRVLEPEAPS